MNALRTIALIVLVSIVATSCALVSTSTYPSRSGAYFGERPDGGRVRSNEPSGSQLPGTDEAESTVRTIDTPPNTARDAEPDLDSVTDASDPVEPELDATAPSGPITMEGVAQLVPGQETQIVWTISPTRRYVFLSATRTLEGLSEVVRSHTLEEPIHIMMIDDARGRFVALLLVVLPTVDVDGLVRYARRSGYRSAAEVTSLEEVIVATRNLELVRRTGQ